MKRRAIAVLALVAVGWLVLCDGSDLRVATFNIENYPKSARQEELAFEAIRSLGAAAVGVQEITEPEQFAEAAKRRLGERWRFAWPALSPKQRVGVLYDDARLELVGHTTHRDTVVYENAKPAFEARLRDREDGDVFSLVVVHFKAGRDGHETRRRQLAGLRLVIERLADTDPFFILGDFNSTGRADRDAIEALADETEIEWASKHLECTSFWTPSQRTCEGSALDHVLASDGADDVTARGPCETAGCDPSGECPVYPSDHCPVTVDL